MCYYQLMTTGVFDQSVYCMLPFTTALHFTLVYVFSPVPSFHEKQLPNGPTWLRVRLSLSPRIRCIFPLILTSLTFLFSPQYTIYLPTCCSSDLAELPYLPPITPFPL